MATPKSPFDRAAENEAVARVLRLMAIPAASGAEKLVADEIRRELNEAGADESWISTDTAHRKAPILGDTGNLICKFPGTFRGERRLLMAHMDTVPICVGTTPKRAGTVIRSANPKTGVGADNRAGVATLLTAATMLLRKKIPHPPLTFVWTIQEEIGLHGARLLQLGKLGRPQLAFNWDGGSPVKLTIGATGGYRMQIRVIGKAAHAGNAPEQGISAIAIAGLAIADLLRKGWHGAIRKGKHLGTSNVGVIQGGNATNVVTDQVTLRVEARSHDPEFRRQIVNEIEQAFQRAVAQVKNVAGESGQIEFHGQLDYESYRLDAESPPVKAARDAVEALGLTAELAISNGGLDSNWLSARGIPTVTLGCGQRQPHMTTESLEIPEFLTACRLALHIASGDGHAA